MTADNKITVEDIFNKTKEKYKIALMEDFNFEPQNYTFIIGVKCAELIIKYMIYKTIVTSTPYSTLYGIKVEVDMVNKYRVSLVKEIK